MRTKNEDKRKHTNYSVAFKMQVVEEVENGLISAEGARKLYGISGKDSIPSWMEKYGINNRINKAVYVMTQKEELEIVVLRKENKRLKKALDDSHVQELVWESLVEIAEEELQVNLKKKFGLQLAKKLKEKLTQSD
ncbi:MAG: transposase [Candidatus Cloacimonas sp.]|jgi:transposase|nr:transposase [Candidatus Cloacimonas sp.]